MRTSQALCCPNVSAAAAVGLLIKEEARSIKTDIKILSRAQNQRSASCLVTARAQPDATASRCSFDLPSLPRATDLALRSMVRSPHSLHRMFLIKFFSIKKEKPKQSEHFLIPRHLSESLGERLWHRLMPPTSLRLLSLDSSEL